MVSGVVLASGVFGQVCLWVWASLLCYLLFLLFLNFLVVSSWLDLVCGVASFSLVFM